MCFIGGESKGNLVSKHTQECDLYIDFVIDSVALSLLTTFGHSINNGVCKATVLLTNDTQAVCVKGHDPNSRQINGDLREGTINLPHWTFLVPPLIITRKQYMLDNKILRTTSPHLAQE